MNEDRTALEQTSAAELTGPVVQSVAIGFKALYLATLALAAFWASGNMRQVPPGSQAVLTRFGAIVGVREAGLVTAWPRPIEQVTLLPGRDRQLSLVIAQGEPMQGLQDVYTRAAGAPVAPDSGGFLTGDGGVVLLRASVNYQIDDAAAYLLARDHVEPALRRLFLSSAVAITAARELDDFLVTRTDRLPPARAAELEAMRAGVRAAFVDAMNRRLSDLARSGASLGITISRVDLEASLPPTAKLAFDSVLEAGQLADQSVAQARTDSARILQAAEQEKDRVITAARAQAEERVSQANSQTASIAAIETRMTPDARPGLLDQVYRDRLTDLMQHVGKVTAVDPRGARVILPGSKP